MPILIPAKLNSKGENAHFGQTDCKIHYNNLCIRFGTRKVQHLNSSLSKEAQRKFPAGLDEKNG